ncbi:zinc-binding dehydrogenase, partial [Streptomyces oceani]
YAAFDLGDVPAQRLGEILRTVVDLLRDDAAHPPPPTVSDLRRAPEALRTLSQGRNVGKFVLALPPAPDPNGTVLITGATGVLGSLVARHLVTAHGARRLL